MDRAVVAGRVVRRHQEDMCQAVGIRPSKKYEIGRPSERMARLVSEFTDEPRVQATALFRQLAFRAPMGDEVGHGKNYSLLIDDGTVTLSPLYDSLCTLGYPDLTGKMATKIGSQQSLTKVDRQALIAEARAMGLTEPERTPNWTRLRPGSGPGWTSWVTSSPAHGPANRSSTSSSTVRTDSTEGNPSAPNRPPAVPPPGPSTGRPRAERQARPGSGVGVRHPQRGQFTGMSRARSAMTLAPTEPSDR
jgi:hypothetical protein